MKVFVIGLNGTRLMPCSPCKARKLLNNNKAKVYRKRPFTIQLLYKTGSNVAPLTLGIDTGSQHIGVAVVSEDTVLYKAEITLRTTMEKKSLLAKRKEYRRGRRYRKVRYRHPKFRHKTKRVYSEKKVKRKSTKHMTHWEKIKKEYTTNRQPGWLPPSMQSKVDQHISWIKRLLSVLPASTRLSIEVARFDIARIKDPEIHGEEYQHGPQYDHENKKAYVFYRDNYKCKCCGAKGGTKRKDGTTVKLIAHHIDFRSRGASDMPERMATVCDRCHSPETHKEGGILYEWMQEGKTIKNTYRDETFMNIVRVRLFEAFPLAHFTYGNITAANRKRLALPKTHANDAVAIAAGNRNITKSCSDTVYFDQVRKKKRSLHEANPRKGRKEPNRKAKRNSKNTKAVKGFCLYDKVSLRGQTGWITGFSGDDTAYVKDAEGNYIKKEGKDYKQVNLSELTVICHNNNWITYSREDG